MSDPFDNFRVAMRGAGLDYSGPVVADGKLHRIKVEGDKARNSWFVLHAGPPMAGAFGCWKRGPGAKGTWCEKQPKDYTAAQWRKIQSQWKQADIEREQAERICHAAARKTAAWTFDKAQPVTTHGYITNKRIQPHGELRQRINDQGIDELVLPLRDADGVLHSLQFIDTDGDKRFLPGGRVAGCFFTLSDTADGPLVVCEGYATGASIFQATGHAIVCAMNAGNLEAVAKAVRAKFPARDIIVAADNDQWTTGNPGLTKATAAAKAIGARLAVPQFKDIASKPTDFNDLHPTKGLKTVNDQVEAAKTPKESDEEAIARLAKLPLIDYERCRDSEAEKLGIKRVSILDKLVDAQRPEPESAGDELQGRTMSLANVEPWPDSVDGASVLDEAAKTFSRYVALPDGAADALALWAAHAHTYESFTCSPRLNITSPEKGCGKSTLRDVLAMLVPRPLSTENLSVAVLFRVIESKKPTMLADECDAWLGDNEELRGLLNSGHRRGGQALRCEGENNEVRAFGVFAPAVLCGIGSLPGTLHDRSIIVRLERKKPGEFIERFESRQTAREEVICRKLARFCTDNTARIEANDPTLPPSAFNRVADNWRPLFAVAEIAGGDWPQRVAIAFTKLASLDDMEAQGIGTMLLSDIRQVLTETKVTRIFSRELVKQLCAMSDRPWSEANKTRPITEHWLARRLRPFRIHPATLHIGEAHASGYESAKFEAAFTRYLANQGDSNLATLHTHDAQALTPKHNLATPERLARVQNGANRGSDKDLQGSKVENPRSPSSNDSSELSLEAARELTEFEFV